MICQGVVRVMCVETRRGEGMAASSINREANQRVSIDRFFMLAGRDVTYLVDAAGGEDREREGLAVVESLLDLLWRWMTGKRRTNRMSDVRIDRPRPGNRSHP